PCLRFENSCLRPLSHSGGAASSYRSDADGALSEIALGDLHVDARRLLARERLIERRIELLDVLDPETAPAACLDDLLVARVVESRGDGAVSPVDLDLAAPDLRPARVVADERDDGDVLSSHRLELDAVEAEATVTVDKDDVGVG